MFARCLFSADSVRYSGLSFSELGQSFDGPSFGGFSVLSGTAYAGEIPVARSAVCGAVFGQERCDQGSVVGLGDRATAVDDTVPLAGKWDAYLHTLGSEYFLFLIPARIVRVGTGITVLLCAGYPS